LPGFITYEMKKVALGDAIKRLTRAAGIHRSGECQKFGASLNAWMVFGSGKR
jgi:hypothetical protein